MSAMVLSSCEHLVNIITELEGMSRYAHSSDVNVARIINNFLVEFKPPLLKRRHMSVLSIRPRTYDLGTHRSQG